MTLSTEQHALLDRPLTKEQIATRTVGKGRQAAYLEGFEAIRQANRVFGHGGWGMTVDDLQFQAMSSGGFYRATVTVTVAGCEPQQDVGGCVAQNDTAEQHDMAFKGAVTDAMKRALRHYGTAFGNDLYSDDAPVAAATAQQQPARQQTQRPPLRTANTAAEEDYAAVTALLRADTEGAEKLPKPPGQMTPEELRKTRDWLEKRQSPTQTNDDAEAAALETQHRRLYNAAQRDQEGKILLLSYLKEQGKTRITEMTMAEATEWLLVFHDREVTPDAAATVEATV